MESWKITLTEESSENQQEEDSFGPSSNEESGSEPSISKNDTKIDDIEDKLHLVTDSKIWLHAQDRIKQVMETTDSLICITQVTVLFMDKLQSNKDLVTRALATEAIGKMRRFFEAWNGRIVLQDEKDFQDYLTKPFGNSNRHRDVLDWARILQDRGLKVKVFTLDKTLEILCYAKPKIEVYKPPNLEKTSPLHDGK